MSDNKRKEIELLIDKAAKAEKSDDAMRFSQAACNSANTMICVCNTEQIFVSGTEAQIKRMVDRFLAWPLPENLNPDGGISFQRSPDDIRYNRPMPTGTNFLDATQAEAMVRYLLAE